MNENTSKVVDLDVNSILPNRFQPRIQFNEEAILELSDSIKEHGLINPILVRPIGDKYEIIAGERRYKASVLAGKDKISAIVINLNDKDSAEIALIENIQRRNLSSIEEAISYKKILDMGAITQEQLASKLGKSQSSIANKIRLLNLSDEIQEALVDNKISERHARSLLRLKTREKQNQMLERIISERLTVRRTDEEIDKMNEQNQNVFSFGQAPIEQNNSTSLASIVPESSTVNLDAPQVPSAGFVPTMPEAPQMPTAGFVPTVSEAPQVPSAGFAPTMPEAPQMPTAGFVPTVSEAPQVPSAGFVPTVSEAPQMPTAGFVPTVPEAPQMPEAGFVPTMPEAPQMPEAGFVPTVSEAPQMPEAGFVPTMPEAPQMPTAEFVPTMPEAPQMPEAGFVPTMPEAPQMPEAGFVPTMPEAPQMPEASQPNSMSLDTSLPSLNIPSTPIIESIDSISKEETPSISVPDFGNSAENNQLLDQVKPEPIIIADYDKQYDPVMPQTIEDKKSTVDFKDIINIIRECSNKIESYGYKIDVDEFDLNNLYQVVFKIEK